MYNYTKDLLQYFVDGTPLSNTQLQFLLDNGFVKEIGYNGFTLTDKGKEHLK